jgi:hypothetical protein
VAASAVKGTIHEMRQYGVIGVKLSSNQTDGEVTAFGERETG